MVKTVVIVLMLAAIAGGVFYILEYGNPEQYGRDNLNRPLYGPEEEQKPDVVDEPEIVPEPEMFEARIGETVSLDDISITPISVLEDSRCPADVVCIQAGTVQILLKLSMPAGETGELLTLDKPFLVDDKEITLKRVLPELYSSVQIKNEDYIFYFNIEKL